MSFLSNLIPTKLNLKATPEVLILLPIAIMADATGYILLIFGLDDFGVRDLICDPIFTLWIMVRKKDPTVFKKIFFRLFGIEALELTPYLGEILPGYTILVIMTILDSQKADEARQTQAADSNENDTQGRLLPKPQSTPKAGSSKGVSG
jgi:hypothetical protein